MTKLIVLLIILIFLEKFATTINRHTYKTKLSSKIIQDQSTNLAHSSEQAHPSISAKRISNFQKENSQAEQSYNQIVKKIKTALNKKPTHYGSLDLLQRFKKLFEKNEADSSKPSDAKKILNDYIISYKTDYLFGKKCKLAITIVAHTPNKSSRLPHLLKQMAEICKDDYYTLFDKLPSMLVPAKKQIKPINKKHHKKTIGEVRRLRQTLKSETKYVFNSFYRKMYKMSNKKIAKKVIFYKFFKKDWDDLIEQSIQFDKEHNSIKAKTKNQLVNQFVKDKNLKKLEKQVRIPNLKDLRKKLKFYMKMNTNNNNKLNVMYVIGKLYGKRKFPVDFAYKVFKIIKRFKFYDKKNFNRRKFMRSLLKALKIDSNKRAKEYVRQIDQILEGLKGSKVKMNINKEKLHSGGGNEEGKYAQDSEKV